MVISRFFFAVILAMTIGSCTLVTEPNPAPDLNGADHPVINEVYTLPIDNLNAVSYIEILNPSNRTFDLKGWKLRYNAPRGDVVSLLFKDTTRSATNEIVITYFAEVTTIRIDSVGTEADVPFAGVDGAILHPNELLTIMTNRNRLEVFMDVADGPGPAPHETEFIQEAPETTKVAVNPNFSNLFVPDTIRSTGYAFYIHETEQLVLKDSSGTVMDVVRMGNYAYPGPGADPYAGNQSVGMVPEYESICRYAGGYMTGNTVNDFYITGPGLRPIPQYYSQLVKR
jgi:Lamin Tail Domain